MGRSFSDGFPKPRETKIQTVEVWVRPTDWPDISNPANNTINLLMQDSVVGFRVTVASAGTYTVDWGDGTSSAGVASGGLAKRLYVGGTGTPCSRGYTTHIVKITATNTITKFAVDPHALSAYTANGILDAEFGTAGLNQISDAFYYATGYASELLEHCRFNQPCPGVTNASYGMFRRCISLESVEGLHNLYNLSDGTTMFAYCYNIKSVDLSGMTGLRDATSMFSQCYALKSVNFSKALGITTASSMFLTCTALTSVDISGMTEVASASSMFAGCTGLKRIDISKMLKLTTTASMFTGCVSLTDIIMPLTGPQNLSSANMFDGCSLLLSCDVSSWTAVTNVSYAFRYCYKLGNVTGLAALTQVTNTDSLFSTCTALSTADVSAMTKVTTCILMFANCQMMKTITGTASFGSTAASTAADGIFQYSEKLSSALDFSGMKPTRFGVYGQSGFLSKFVTLTVHASSTYPSASAPQLHIAYGTFSAAQLDTIFNALPILATAKTIDVTGCVGNNKGTASCAATAASAVFLRNPTTGYVVGKYLTGFTVNSGITCTFQDAGDTVTKNGHGLANGTPITFSAIAITTGITIKTIYYVVGTAANTFQVEASVGGGAIALVNDGTGTFQFQQKIISVNPNVSFTCDNPSATTVTATMIATDCNVFLANNRGWVVTA